MLSDDLACAFLEELTGQVVENQRTAFPLDDLVVESGPDQRFRGAGTGISKGCQSLRLWIAWRALAKNRNGWRCSSGAFRSVAMYGSIDEILKLKIARKAVGVDRNGTQDAFSNVGWPPAAPACLCRSKAAEEVRTGTTWL